MSVLIADSAVPFARSFAAFLAAQNLPSGLLTQVAEASPASGLGIDWNPASRLSALTAILEMKTRYGKLDRALLCFDLQAFSHAAPSLTVVDERIKSYILLVSLLKETFGSQGSGEIVFFHRVSPHVPAQSAGSLVLQVAESAFVRLGEETAKAGNALLVRHEGEGEPDSLEWMAERLANPTGGKIRSSWLKYGAKGLLGF